MGVGFSKMMVFESPPRSFFFVVFCSKLAIFPMVVRVEIFSIYFFWGSQVGSLSSKNTSNDWWRHLCVDGPSSVALVEQQMRLAGG